MKGWDIRRMERTISVDIGEAQTKHLERVKESKYTFAQGVSFVEVLNSYQRIANHSVSIAGAHGSESIKTFGQEAIL